MTHAAFTGPTGAQGSVMAACLHSEMINLARATDRKAHMAGALDAAGIAVTLHPAIDSREMPEEEIYAHVQREGPWGYVHPAAAACTLSHAKVWERFLETDKTHCLVLEDDIHISRDLSLWLGDLSWWPEDAGIVKLERWRSKSLSVLLERSGTHHLGRRIARVLNRHVGAAGYILTRPAAKAMLARRPLPLVVDNLLFNINASPALRDLKIYQIAPAQIVQGNEPEGWIKPPLADYRPKGCMLLRQKLKRGYYELAYPLSTWRKLMTGDAVLEKITYADVACAPSAPAQPAFNPTLGARPAQTEK